METKFKGQNINNKKINLKTRNIIGCKAIGNGCIESVANEFGVNEEFVIGEKMRVLRALEANEEKEKIIKLDKDLTKRIIIGCMLLCKASTEDCKRFLLLIFGICVSIGKISGIISEASHRAKEWNESIDLSGISIGAHDEIFQGKTPILVGVDPRTTFTYLFKIVPNRNANTWAISLLEKSENQGLMLTGAVSDAGKGIIKGTKDTFGDEINYQSDVFHVEYEFNNGLKALENYVYKCIKEHNEFFKKCKKDNDFLDKLDKVKNKEISVIQAYDNLSILFLWIKELLGRGGYFYDERVELFKFIIVELDEIKVKNNALNKSINFMKNNIKQMLQFVKLAELNMSKIAISEGISEEVLRKIWRQKAHRVDSLEYNRIEAEIGLELKTRYESVKNTYNDFERQIIRASSIVECINSLIRPYINLKRSIPKKFTHLLQFYFNTREYRRSRVAERCGKSPYELHSGEKIGNMMDILCPIAG